MRVSEATLNRGWVGMGWWVSGSCYDTTHQHFLVSYSCYSSTALLAVLPGIAITLLSDACQRRNLEPRGWVEMGFLVGECG